MRVLVSILWAAGATSAAGILLAWQTPFTSVAAAPAPPEESRTIPLESCFATFDGSGCKYLRSSDAEPYGYDLGQIYLHRKSGASNVVLVRGKDVVAAVRAVRWAFTGGMPADTPVLPDLHAREAKGEPLWLVADLGIGSTPGLWRIQAAETRGMIVRLTYSWTKITGPSTAMERKYFVWVPLGQAKAGTYVLELYDAGRKEVMLLRRVAVSKP